LQKEESLLQKEKKAFCRKKRKPFAERKESLLQQVGDKEKAFCKVGTEENE
jgi:hypothetical protein